MNGQKGSVASDFIKTEMIAHGANASPYLKSNASPGQRSLNTQKYTHFTALETVSLLR
jgi:hypothetical protein